MFFILFVLDGNERRRERERERESFELFGNLSISSHPINPAISLWATSHLSAFISISIEENPPNLRTLFRKLPTSIAITRMTNPHHAKQVGMGTIWSMMSMMMRRKNQTTSNETEHETNVEWSGKISLGQHDFGLFRCHFEAHFRS